ncbi:MAG: SRPBCC domain-containing protein [Streptosporangiaceae bacterium]
MNLEHSFTVPVPEERAWQVLLDVERVAPCLPGATVDSVDGDEITGRIKVRVGPIAMTYAGTARFVEQDPGAHYITLEASGKETRGAGTASARIRSILEGQGDQTHVIVHTSLNITGKPAQLGRGVMSEVSGKLIGIFAANLAEMLTAQGPAAAAAGAGPEGGTVTADGTAAADGAQPAGAAGGGAQTAGAGASDGAAAGSSSLPLEELRLPLRSYNSLRRQGVHTIGELAAHTPQQLLAIENIGPASVEEIRQRLAEHGLALTEAGAGQASTAAAAGTAAAAAAAEGGAAAAEMAAAGQVNGSAPAGQAPPPRPVPPSPAPFRPADDDAPNLLSVAGFPVLKRALPTLAGVAAGVAIGLVLGRRRRRG